MEMVKIAEGGLKLTYSVLFAILVNHLEWCGAVKR